MQDYIVFSGRLMLICLISFFSLQSCEEPYNPVLEESDVAPTLVVDGFINLKGNSSFTIGWSQPIYQGEGAVNPNNLFMSATAQVSVRSEHGAEFLGVKQDGSNEYLVEHPELDPQTAYYLRIEVGNAVYESTPSKALQTGAIDELDYRVVDDDRVEIILSSNDASHSTPYYRWEFEETWRFRSAVPPDALFENGVIVPITPETDIGTCYRDFISGNIIIASTAQFTQNRIYQQPIQSIGKDSEKIISRYSILVKQYAISPEAYKFWEMIRKNSEEIGDIFGVMPSEVGGNIRNIVDPNEKVVGFIEVLSPTEKRIFISNFDLPARWMHNKIIDFYRGCAIPDTIFLGEAPAFFTQHPGYLPAQFFYPPTSPEPNRVSYSAARCVDCRFYGRIEKPLFWID